MGHELGTEAKRRPLSPGRGRAPGQPEGKIESSVRPLAAGSRARLQLTLPPCGCQEHCARGRRPAQTQGRAPRSSPSLLGRGTAERARGPHTVAAMRGQSRLPVRSEEAQAHTHALADLHAHAHTNSRTCMYTHSRTHAPACAHTHMHSFSAAAVRVRVCRGGRGRPRSVSPVGVCAPTQGPGPRFLTAPHPPPQGRVCEARTPRPARRTRCARPSSRPWGPHGSAEMG